MTYKAADMAPVNQNEIPVSINILILLLVL